MKLDKGEKEICFECGKSVKLGSGKFVNRIPSFDSMKQRKDNGATHPEGAFLCDECDEQRSGFDDDQ